MSEKITQLQSKTENHQSQITQISSTQVATDGKVNALWTLKVDANGAIGGIMLGSDGKESQFKVAADSFIVSTGNQDKNLFIIQNIDGKDVASLNVNDFIINGSLDAKKIKADSFEGVKITGVEINAGKFYGGSIVIGGTAEKPNFSVDENGRLYAKEGVFEGVIYAEKIEGEISEVYTAPINSSGRADVLIPPAKHKRRFTIINLNTKAETFTSKKNELRTNRIHLYRDDKLIQTFEAVTFSYVDSYAWYFLNLPRSIVHVGIIAANTSTTISIQGNSDRRGNMNIADTGVLQVLVYRDI